MTRRIFFLTGQRSEYDLVTPVIRAVNLEPGLEAHVLACAGLLSPFHGRIVEQVRQDGFDIVAEVESLVSSESWEGRALSFANLTAGLTRFLAVNRPDLLFVTGDREESLSGAIVGNFLGIHTAHLHGGDRCIAADVDEVLRPAISKLAHFHFTANEDHRQRLIKMGESPDTVWAHGAPGLDRFVSEPNVDNGTLQRELGIDVSKPFFLLIYHPCSTMSADSSREEMREILTGMLSLGHPVLCSYPNTDPGNIGIRQAINEVKSTDDRLIVYHHLSRLQFVALYKRTSAIVGNSSSLVLESGFLKVPAILVGPRQDLRQASANIMRIDPEQEAVREACLRALSDQQFLQAVKRCESPYGDGKAATRIARTLTAVPLTPDLLRKVMTY